MQFMKICERTGPTHSWRNGQGRSKINTRTGAGGGADSAPEYWRSADGTRRLSLPRVALVVATAAVHWPAEWNGLAGLWEGYVIEGLDNFEGLPPGCFATFNKTHHAAIDGATGAHLTAATQTQNPNDEIHIPEESDSWAPEPEPTDVHLLMKAHFNQFRKES